MRSQIVGLNVAGAVFGVMAVLQLARLVIRPQVLVQGHLIPLWPSVLALVLLGGLCMWMLGLARGLAHLKQIVQ